MITESESRACWPCRDQPRPPTSRSPHLVSPCTVPIPWSGLVVVPLLLLLLLLLFLLLVVLLLLPLLVLLLLLPLPGTARANYE